MSQTEDFLREIGQDGRLESEGVFTYTHTQHGDNKSHHYLLLRIETYERNGIFASRPRVHDES